MFTARTRRTPRGLTLLATAAGATLLLAACASGDPLATDDADVDTIVVGSQAYYSNEIVAEIYAQALEDAGFEVDRRFSIGQRDAYLPALEGGEVHLFPEYTGNLLQFYAPDTTATAADEVYAELADALPEGLTVLDQSSASDQDSYNVTADFASEYQLQTIADLENVTEEIVLGGPPELEERPYGPSGLLDLYGLTVSFEATGDLTVESLLAGQVNVANVFSADPRIGTENLVTLADPEGLFLASNVVPLVSSDVADEIADTINAVSAALTAEDLVALNVQSVEEQASPAVIATQWLTENILIAG